MLDPGIDSILYNATVTMRASRSGFLRSGELACRTGVSPDTLRHYERLGLLPKPGRSANGYREYPPDAVERVLMIQRALTVGFTLAELKHFLGVRDKGGAPCHDVRKLAEAKLAGIEARLLDLIALRDKLRSLLEDWDRRLSSTPRTQAAGLLQSLLVTDLTDLDRGSTPKTISSKQGRKGKGRIK